MRGGEPNDADMGEHGEPSARIILHSGPLAGKFFPLDKPSITIGRAEENDITLDDAQVSRHHARLISRDRVVIIEDLGSTNGSLVNGKPINKPHVLQPADKVSIGSTVLTIEGSDAPSTLFLVPERQQALASSIPPAPPKSLSKKTTVEAAAGAGISIPLILSLIGLVILILAGASAAAYFLTQKTPTPTPTRPEVTILAPINGSQVKANEDINIQINARDTLGVTRVELRVRGNIIDSVTSPLSGGDANLQASMKWRPGAAGSYTLEVIAYNIRGAASQPTTVILTAIAPTVTATSALQAETATSTPTPTPTVSPSIPSLTAITDLNIRDGPGTDYQRIGVIGADVEAEIIGKSEDAKWWKIRMDNLPGGEGWVSAEYTRARNVQTVPVITVPTPTPTPTSTQVMTTATSSPFPSPTPGTPQPTRTPNAEGITFEFTAGAASLEPGECTNLNWFIDGVKAIYLNGGGFDNKGLSGPQGSQEVCPKKKTTYTIRVIKPDNSESKKSVTIYVPSEGAPTAPDGLEAPPEDISDTSIKLRWNDRSNNEEGFHLYDAKTNDLIKTIDANKTTTIVSDLHCDTAYPFFIVSFNDVGESPNSNIITVTTSGCP